MSRLARAATLAVLCCVFQPARGADILVLNNGGRLQGRWVNRDQRPLVSYEFVTSTGVRLVLPRRQVQRVGRWTDVQSEYRARVPDTPDTLDAQWDLAKWCRSSGLRTESRAHLERVVQFDPDHDEARRLLGYRWWRGRWLTREEVDAETGYVVHEGRRRTLVEAELLESQSVDAKRQQQWRNDLRRWCKQLQTGDAARARQQIETARELICIAPLRERIDAERLPAVRLLLLRQLLEIDGGESTMTLAELVLQTDSQRLLDETLTELLRRERPALVEYYVKALDSNHQGHVNRAAAALGELGDPSAITPLIETLHTTHWQIRPGQSMPLPLAGLPKIAGQPRRCDAATQTSCPSFHKSVQLTRRSNPQVLHALTKLSQGRNFGYHAPPWRIWNQTRLAADASVRQAGGLDR